MAMIAHQEESITKWKKIVLTKEEKPEIINLLQKGMSYTVMHDIGLSHFNYPDYFIYLNTPSKGNAQRCSDNGECIEVHTLSTCTFFSMLESQNMTGLALVLICFKIFFNFTQFSRNTRGYEEFSHNLQKQ